MSALERRYRRLLRAYPAWYLADRGEEMLGTLLDASPEYRIWPSARDAVALAAGGLRARSGLGQRQPVLVSVRLGVVLAITLLLLQWGEAALTSTARSLWGLIFSGHSYVLSQQDGLTLAWMVLGAAAAIAAWLGRRVLVVVAALGAVTALWAMNGGRMGPFILISTAALAGLALLARSGERLPNSWLWLVGAEFSWFLLFEFGPSQGDGWLAAIALHYSLYAAVALWALIDARPALAVGLGLAYGQLTYDVPGLPGSLDYWQVEALLAGAVFLTATAIWRFRRQAVL